MGICVILRSQGHGRLRRLNNVPVAAKLFLTHPKCASAPGNSRLPLRLINVMPGGETQLRLANKTGHDMFDQLSSEECPGVQISFSRSIPPGTPYATLSHRWGNPPSILLTKRTSLLLEGDISPQLLRSQETAVFRHTIHVTRTLGFRYLWIDALCIMQDDEAEKMMAIMYMDEIYFNSAPNISATEGMSEGLAFVVHGPRFDKTFVLPANPSSGHITRFPVQYADFGYRNEIDPTRRTFSCSSNLPSIRVQYISPKISRLNSLRFVLSILMNREWVALIQLIKSTL